MIFLQTDLLLGLDLSKAMLQKNYHFFSQFFSLDQHHCHWRVVAFLFLSYMVDYPRSPLEVLPYFQVTLHPFWHHPLVLFSLEQVACSHLIQWMPCTFPTLMHNVCKVFSRVHQGKTRLTLKVSF